MTVGLSGEVRVPTNRIGVIKGSFPRTSLRAVHDWKDSTAAIQPPSCTEKLPCALKKNPYYQLSRTGSGTFQSIILFA
jgi:hypothetical protein